MRYRFLKTYQDDSALRTGDKPVSIAGELLPAPHPAHNKGLVSVVPLTIGKMICKKTSNYIFCKTQSNLNSAKQGSVREHKILLSESVSKTAVLLLHDQLQELAVFLLLKLW